MHQICTKSTIVRADVEPGKYAAILCAGFEIAVHLEERIGAFPDVLLIVQAVVDRILDHAADEGDVRAGAHEGMDICPGRTPVEPGIHVDEYAAVIQGLLHVLHGHGVVFRRIAAQDQDNIGILDIGPAVGHATSAKRLSQSRYGYRGRMRRLVFLASCDRITLKRLTQSKRLQREEDQPCIE